MIDFYWSNHIFRLKIFSAHFIRDKILHTFTKKLTNRRLDENVEKKLKKYSHAD